MQKTLTEFLLKIEKIHCLTPQDFLLVFFHVLLYNQIRKLRPGLNNDQHTDIKMLPRFQNHSVRITCTYRSNSGKFNSQCLEE